MFQKYKERYSKEEIAKMSKEIKECRKSLKSYSKRMSDSDVIDYMKGLKIQLQPKKGL